MKRAAAAIRELFGSVRDGFGLEGAFLAIGTGALAVWASYFGPGWPWFVVGSVSILAGVALARPVRRQ